MKYWDIDEYVIDNRFIEYIYAILPDEYVNTMTGYFTNQPGAIIGNENELFVYMTGDNTSWGCSICYNSYNNNVYIEKLCGWESGEYEYMVYKFLIEYTNVKMMISNGKYIINQIEEIKDQLIRLEQLTKPMAKDSYGHGPNIIPYFDKMIIHLFTQNIV